jgi:hypothetical protein
VTHTLRVIGLVLARDEVEAELGIKIQEVRQGSTSELVGIRAGEYIHRLDGEVMSSIERFDAVIKRHLPGETLEVALRDDYGTERVVLLEVGACGKTIDEVGLPRDRSQRACAARGRECSAPHRQVRELRKHAAAMTVIWDDRTPVAETKRAPARRASQTLRSREDFLAAMLGAIGGADGDTEPKRSPSTPGRRGSMPAMTRHHSDSSAAAPRPITPGGVRRGGAAAEWVSPMEAERAALRANDRRRSMPATDARTLLALDCLPPTFARRQLGQ